MTGGSIMEKFSKIRIKPLQACGLSAVLALGFGASSVNAQSGEEIDEIIVTARKRSESIQDVPVAVSALTAAQLQKGNIPMTQDLGKLVPNVALHDMAYAGAGLSASIR